MGYVLLLQLSTLVVVEHRSGKVAGATHNTVTAAHELGGDITALVGGQSVHDVAQQAAQIPGISKVRPQQLAPMPQA